ncbi:MAG: tol-pal system protein YbgF [Gemmatimonadota bacterium]
MSFRRVAVLFCLAAAATAAGGCAVADTGAFVRLQEEMEGLKRQVAELRAAPPPAAASEAPSGRIESDDVSALRKSVADASADVDRVKSDLLAVSTRLDETKVALQKEVSRLNGATAELGQSLQDVKARLARLDELERKVAALEEKVGRLAAAQPPPAAPAAAAGAGEWKSPEEMYDYALGLIKGGETRKAREVLSAFAARYPDNRLMQNVYYWKGETFYVEKDFENAILSFQDVIDRFPGGDKAPDAMLKQGLSFQALKDAKNARIVLELLVTKYPKSPAAEKARQKLAELK